MHDLHTHSNISDGGYTPSRLVREAVAAGITTLALTDHDSIAGLSEATVAAQEMGMQLIGGVEISTTWEHKGLHIIGLNVDPDCEILQKGLLGIQMLRMERAREIGRRLEKFGFPGVFEAVQAISADGMITRTHFAKYLYDLGMAATVRDAFERYLARGKPGYVATQWGNMEEAIHWIQSAGGVSVIAHPQRYKLTNNWLRRLIGEFREMGGVGLEVVYGTAAPGDVQSSAEHAKRFGLLASCGSDFHRSEFNWPKLGRLPAIPPGLVPIWSIWDIKD